MTYLDTHVAAWLYAGELGLLSDRAQEILSRDELLISPIVVLELQYLFEVGRTTEPASPVVEALRSLVGLEVCDLPFGQVIGRSLSETWTRDPFDRVVVSQAAVRSSPLLTKDKTIHTHYVQAVWE